MMPCEPVKIGNMCVKTVNKYVYLGHDIRIDRDNQTCEMSRTITLDWAAYGKMRELFKENIPISLKKKAFNKCIIPVLTYGAKTLLTRKTIVTNTLEEVYVQQ